MKKTNSLRTVLLSLVVMALWGSLFPCIKLGYAAFAISSTDIPGILMFAGVRFTLCGVVICAIACLKKDTIAAPKLRSVGTILLIGLFSIILHYAFLYIGISSTDSSKTALIKQLGSLLYVCFAFLFFPSEKFSVWKIVGALVGFAGIVAINFSPEGITFSLADILILSASACSVIANIFSKKIAANNSPFWMTGIAQLAGGIVLMLAAFVMGANMLTFTWQSAAVFAYICTASTVAYVLWNAILKTSDLSNMFIIKFAEPLFACLFGAVLLGENIFKLQYLLAFVLISTGIILGNKRIQKNES